MRRTASAVGLALAIALGIGTAQTPQALADDCAFDPASGYIVCQAHGDERETTAPTARTGRNGEAPPRIYVHTATDPAVGDCYFVSATPGGLDITDPLDEPLIVTIVTTLPPCPGIAPVVTPEEIQTRAWEIFRSFALALPEPAMQPPAAGITGLPTYLSAAEPDPITYSELLPDGRTLSVRATVGAIQVDWGDGFAATHLPSQALPYPEGLVTHTYAVKTCPPEYRETHPSGGNCHPTLEAYPIAATFVWAGDYSVGGPWIELGTLPSTATIAYDIDEVQGVLQS